MATWPADGTDPWSTELKTYIDDGDEAAADAANITTVPVSPFVGTTVQANLDELTPLVPRSSGTPWTALADSGRGGVELRVDTCSVVRDGNQLLGFFSRTDRVGAGSLVLGVGVDPTIQPIHI